MHRRRARVCARRSWTDARPVPLGGECWKTSRILLPEALADASSATCFTGADIRPTSNDDESWIFAGQVLDTSCGIVSCAGSAGRSRPTECPNDPAARSSRTLGHPSRLLDRLLRLRLPTAVDHRLHCRCLSPVCSLSIQLDDVDAVGGLAEQVAREVVAAQPVHVGRRPARTRGGRRAARTCRTACSP